MCRCLRILSAASLLLLATTASGTLVSNFGYLSNGQLTPEGNPATFGAGEVIKGRVHINGPGIFNIGEPPVFLGFYSQTEPFLDGFDPDGYFPNGWSAPHAALDFNFDEALQTIREHCLPDNLWQGHQDSLELTTLIRFDGSMYHAAQYAESQINGLDTLWHTPWTTLPLPWPPQPTAIVVEGVARVKGIITGQVTLLAADSLFIMGDLITSDTILEPCGGDPPEEGTLFGTVPTGSPNRIGLIGEKDIIVAATLENGFANGLNAPALDCGLVNHGPVVTVCDQRRQDVIITAAILALGCTFECEFWKTPAWGASIPSPTPQVTGCGGDANTQVTVWDNSPGGVRPDCLGASELDDQRGTLWFCGSMAVVHPGYFLRNPMGPWGNAWIGYHYKARRYDLNLLSSAPPWWPDAAWVTSLPIDVLQETGAASSCGPVGDPAAFIQDWSQGEVRLRLRNADLDNGQLLVLTRVNGQTADSAWVTGGGEAFIWWTPTLDLTPWLSQDATLRLEVQLGERVGLHPPTQWDIYTRWNAEGEECAWTWNASTTVAPAMPAAFSLSLPWPNPFNPVTHVELSLPAAGAVRLEIFDLAGRLEAVIHDGPLATGEHAFTIDGATWPAGLHLLRVTHDGAVVTCKLLLIK